MKLEGYVRTGGGGGGGTGMLGLDFTLAAAGKEKRSLRIIWHTVHVL